MIMSVTVTFVGSGDAFGTGGRFQTCILIDAPETRFVIDFGASSLIALNKMGIEHNTIETIVLTHLHGDHCGGIPFILLDAMLGAKRQSPLTIVGPRETEKKLHTINEALMPGMNAMIPKFDLSYVEIDVMKSTQIGNLSSLESLKMSYNNISSRIPSEIKNTSIRHLLLSGNCISSSIPLEIGNMVMMEVCK